MGAYDSDRRVQPHPDGSWIVWADGVDRYVQPLYDQASSVVQPTGRWAIFDTEGWPVDGVEYGSADEAICVLIGAPR